MHYIYIYLAALQYYFVKYLPTPWEKCEQGLDTKEEPGCSSRRAVLRAGHNDLTSCVLSCIYIVFTYLGHGVVRPVPFSLHLRNQLSGGGGGEVLIMGATIRTDQLVKLAEITEMNQPSNHQPINTSTNQSTDQASKQSNRLTDESTNQQSVCEKNHSTNNSFELEKGQIHSDITLTVFAMSESPKQRSRPPYHQHHFWKFIRSPKNTNNLVQKKGKIDWHREAQHIFLGTRRRGTRM